MLLLFSAAPDSSEPLLQMLSQTLGVPGCVAAFSTFLYHKGGGGGRGGQKNKFNEIHFENYDFRSLDF